MKLLHHQEVELSRSLLASLPAGVEVIEGAGGYPVSAYPSVVVDIPAGEVSEPAFGPSGEFLGIFKVLKPAQKELIRMPVTWAAVSEYITWRTPVPVV